MALSYLAGLPTLAFLSYLSVKMSKAIIIAVGGPAVFGLGHIMFGVGVYLAGVQRQLFFPIGDNYFSPLPLVMRGGMGSERREPVG